MSTPTLCIVVPCYNEFLVLDETSKQLSDVLSNMINNQTVSNNSFILFVNDGSADDTWSKIKELRQNNKLIAGVNLAGNVGHQNALMSGLSVASDESDIIVSIDADLQDDVQVIQKMVQEFYAGFDIVYGVRDSRKTDKMFKRTTALVFYKLMTFLGVVGRNKIVDLYSWASIAKSRVSDFNKAIQHN